MSARERQKKRVVMTVANEFTTDYRVHREAKALVDEGYDVTLFCVWKKGLARAEETDGIHVRRVLDGYLRLPLTRQVRKIRRVWWKALVQAQGDIYHAHDRDTLDYTAKIARRRRVPFVYDSHEYWPDKNQYTSNTGSLRDRLSEFLWTWKEGRNARRATRMIMTSPGHASGLVKRHRVAAPTLVRNIPEYQRGTDTSYLRNKFHLSDDDLILAYVGNIQRNRGLEEVIASLARLPEHVHFIAIGYGPFRKELEGNIPKQLKERVHFHDTIPYRDIVPVLYSADIGMAPFQANCYSHRHVLPNKIFEYMMSELPIAVSNLPDMREIIEKTGTGLFFEPNSLRSIAQTVKQLMDQPELRERMRKNARQATEKTYRWDVEKHQLLNLYRSLS